MELVELLMLEHVSFRLQFQHLRQAREAKHFLRLDDFILNCHAKVEDETLFPRLLKLPSATQELSKESRSLAADHKLIERFSHNMHAWADGGNRELFDKRLDNYIGTVEFHNAQEEKLVFPSWRLVEDSERGAALRDAKRIIEGYGLDEYMQTTGVSREFYDSFW